MLVAKNIALSLKNRDILRDVSVSFDTGLHYLIGLNGSGKTSLIRCLLGLLPFQGQVLLANQNLDSVSSLARARKMAVVHQALHVPFRILVKDFTLMGRYPYLNWLGSYKQEDHELVNKQLERLGIADLAYRHLDEISGGELQKVFIARALAQNTPILILDEPAQSLDPKNKDFLYELLHQLASDDKLIICATHDLEPLKNPDARVIGMHSGKVVLDSKGGMGRAFLMEQVFH